MSVIFEDVDNIQNLQFNFTQALRVDKSLYYICMMMLIVENSLLRKVNLIENHFNNEDSVIVQAEVQQICTDGRLVYSLLSSCELNLDNGDLCAIEQPPKLLVSSRNYKWISPTCAIDHSHRGYVWKTNKQIYSHCKHIASYQDRITVITVGGKIFNVVQGENVPISQLNGLQLNTYFKKALLFAFGGVALTESGDLYLFSQKMIRVKVKNIEEVFATQKNIFALQGNTIIQYSLEDLKNHQFFINQSIFQKMHYCNDVELKCKTKQFQQIQLLSSDYSQWCLGYIKDNKVLDTSIGVSTCKQSLFEEWEGRQKKKQAEIRKSIEKVQESTTADDQPTLAQKLATIRESLTFERPASTTPKKVESIKKQESQTIKQKSAIQLHKIIIEDFNVDINDSPPPVKLDNLLNKINVIKPHKTIDQILQGQRELHDSLPTFQNDEQFTQNEQRGTKQMKKQQESSGIESSSGFSQQDSLILDKKYIDYPLQLQPFDKKKNQRHRVDTLDCQELKPLQPSNRSSRKMENAVTDRCSTKRSIDQAKQDLETLVNIITKQKENQETKKPIKVLSPACVQLRPESKVTPLKNRRSSAEETSQNSIRLPIRIPKVQSKTITQQSLQSINQDSKVHTLQDCDDLKSAKLLFDQSIQSKRSEQSKGLVRVSCSSQVIGKTMRTNSLTSKKTSVMIPKKQINRKIETTLSKVFFRLDVRVKLNELEFLNNVKLLL